MDGSCEKSHKSFQFVKEYILKNDKWDLMDG